jgi:photosynthetic reaction center cytochrome c subunit
MRFLLVSLVCALSLFAQEEAAKQAKKAPQPPKNLQIIQDPATVIPTMRAFRTALGVECSFCHVDGNFASDDKPQKQTARMMMNMAKEINAKFPDGKAHVSCYTCHRGENEPKMSPPAAAPAQ